MKNTAYIKLVLLVVVIGVAALFVYKYIKSLPTREERVVIELMNTFKRGLYDECAQYCFEGSFFKVVDQSKVIDTDGSEIDWKSSAHTWSEASLKDSIETYVRRSLKKIEFIQLTTQHLNGGDDVVVSFYAEVIVADYSTGELLGPPVHNGTIEGKCFLKRTADGESKVERFDITLVSFDGLNLKKYLRWMDY